MVSQGYAPIFSKSPDSGGFKWYSGNSIGDWLVLSAFQKFGPYFNYSHACAFFNRTCVYAKWQEGVCRNPQVDTRFAPATSVFINVLGL